MKQKLMEVDGIKIAPFAGARIETIQQDGIIQPLTDRPLRGGAD